MYTLEQRELIRLVQERWTELALGCIRNSAALSAWAAQSDDLLLSCVEPARVTAALDVACGCGDPTLQLAALCPRARVVGLDFIEAQSDELARRARSTGRTNVEARVGDMFELPFVDGEFDLVTCRFGLLRYGCELQRAFIAEASRVLRPGGRLAIVDWGVEGHGAIHGFYHRVLSEYAPSAGLNPDNASERFTTATQFAELFEVCGFESVAHSYPRIYWCWDGAPSALWALIRDVVPPVRAVLTKLDAAATAEVGARIERGLADYSVQSRIALPARNLRVTGVKRDADHAQQEPRR